jgi:hypothetical protein
MPASQCCCHLGITDGLAAVSTTESDVIARHLAAKKQAAIDIESGKSLARLIDAVSILPGPEGRSVRRAIFDAFERLKDAVEADHRRI